MAALIASVLWTVLASALFIWVFGDMGPWERVFVVVFALLGLLAIWASWRDLRRRRSLRIEDDGDTTWFVWVDFDGSTHRSTRDPRDDWDADGDGDGDGGGGD